MRCKVIGLPAIVLSSCFVQAQTNDDPVAYVYVATNPTTLGSASTGKIYGFTASLNGKLSPTTGSPIASSVNNIALNDRWLFGSVADPNGGPYKLESYSIAGNGALKLVDTAQFPSIDGDEEPGNLVLDHTGHTVYVRLGYPFNFQTFESLEINVDNGKLTLDPKSSAIVDSSPITFSANNKFAYGASCYQENPFISSYQRSTSDGSLAIFPNASPLPTAPSGSVYCPTATATDPHNDVVISLQQTPTDGAPVAANQLAVYTFDQYGTLTTTSTTENMYKAAVEGTALAMSPKGFYLASAGPSGIQLFLMHGSKPLTVLTPEVILPNVSISQMFWDNNQHLYAISAATGRLYVLNVTGAGAVQAPGSPYQIPNISSLIVLPK